MWSQTTFGLGSSCPPVLPNRSTQAKFALPVDDGELAAIETHPKLQK